MITKYEQPLLFTLAIVVNLIILAGENAYADESVIFHTSSNAEHKDWLGKRSVLLRRTRHGVVHVKAQSYAGIAYGVAYAYMQDNRCLLAHRIAEVNGRLSEQLGADAPVRSEVHDLTYSALQSDHYYRGWFDIERIRAGFETGAPEVVDMAKAYAAGVNRFLREHKGAKSCTVDFTGEVTQDDVYRMWVATASVASGELVAGLLPHAAPAHPLTTASSNESFQKKLQRAAKSMGQRLTSVGSNAWAIGRDSTRRGRSVHFYNPHFPWAGIQRQYLIHVTIPGKLDAMGVTLGGYPVPLSGFNRRVAWGLTFSTTARWSLAELSLNNPFSYRVNGEDKTISAEILNIAVKGESTPRQIPFFRAGEDPLIDADPFFFGWWDDPNNPRRAYAAHDVNAANTRMVEQFLRIAESSNVRDIKQHLKTIQGVPFSYVVASDKKGEVFFGDISAVPGLSTTDVFNCVVSAVGAFHLPHGIVVLDGGRSECYWNERMHASQQPYTIRTDYVANSNNNHELPHPGDHLTGFSPVFGVANQPLSLRANLGFNMINDRLSGADGLGKPGFNHRLTRTIFHQARNRAAELLVAPIVADCKANPVGQHNGITVDLTDVCLALENWDRRNHIRSRGAAVFRGVWMAVRDAFVSFDSLFETSASIDQPLTTPSGYSTDPLIRTAVRNALARVASTFAPRGIGVDVPWGKVNAVITPFGKYPMPGGFSSEGIFDSIVSADGFYTFDGWASTLDGNQPHRLYGASYMHVVSFNHNGPRATGLLAYSQATEKSSPWYLDQVKRWSRNRWFSLPFREAEIRRDRKLTALRLRLP